MHPQRDGMEGDNSSKQAQYFRIYPTSSGTASGVWKAYLDLEALMDDLVVFVPNIPKTLNPHAWILSTPWKNKTQFKKVGPVFTICCAKSDQKTLKMELEQLNYQVLKGALLDQFYSMNTAKRAEFLSEFGVVLFVNSGKTSLTGLKTKVKEAVASLTLSMEPPTSPKPQEQGHVEPKPSHDGATECLVCLNAPADTAFIHQ